MIELAAKPVWVAQPGSQRLFLSCPVPEMMYEGTRGNGKTDALLIKFARHCGRGYNEHWRGIIFRETYKQLGDIIAKSKRLFYRAFPGIRYNEADFTWKWPTGEELLLRHMKVADDYNNYHGHEYPFIAFEELTNWLLPDCYELMKSCNRSSFEGMPRIYAATCNPFGKGHQWVKKYFIDPAPRGRIARDRFGQQRVAIHGNLFENKALLRADPTYPIKLDSITDPNRRKAWRFGSWTISVGTMFDDLWHTDHHVLPVFDVPKGWTIERAMDWGSSKPFSVGWWARPDGNEIDMPDRKGETVKRTFPRGSYIRIGEWYGWNGEPNKGLRMLSSKVASEIKRKEKLMGIEGRVRPGPADSSIWDEEDGNCVAREMASVGIHFERAWKGRESRHQGWERMRELLDNALDVPVNAPGMWVFETCEQFIRVIPHLPRDEVDLDDVDTDAEDHIGDETRYEVLRGPRDVVQEPLRIY